MISYKKLYFMPYARYLILGICTGILSCSPKMHAIGAGMRLLNTSQNKYSKKNPYYSDKDQKTKKTQSK
jgi:hypothetical protein